MGGLPLDYLERALHYAVSNGVIVCCAAGNIFGANDTASRCGLASALSGSARSRGQQRK